jgi:hypothetical protein
MHRTVSHAREPADRSTSHDGAIHDVGRSSLFSSSSPRSLHSSPVHANTAAMAQQQQVQLPSAQKDADDPTTPVGSRSDADMATMGSAHTPSYMQATGPLYVRGRSNHVPCACSGLLMT